jgi:hypothetical protein
VEVRIRSWVSSVTPWGASKTPGGLTAHPLLYSSITSCRVPEQQFERPSKLKWHASVDVRSRHVRGLVWLFVLSVSAFVQAAEPNSLEGQRIAYLIASVETLQGAQFIRNGTAYNAKAAAEHLRLKLRLAGSRVATAEDFIRLCASSSSVSGTPYQIRFTDGRTVSSEAYLRQKLVEFEP